MNLDAAADAIVQRLRMAGIRATVDERDINPPAVWIKPPTLSFRFGKGGWTAAWTLQLVVPDSGRNVALAALGDLVEQVQTAMEWAGTVAHPIALLIPGGSAPLPGYEMTYNERIT